MKIQKVRFNRSKRVYYFDYRHGVLKGKNASRMHQLSGFMTAVFLIGGLGFGVNQALNYQAEQNTKTSYQRDNVAAVSASSEANTASDKLKNASLKAREDEQLAKQIKTKLKNIPGGQKWSVYVRDVKSDRMASINADTVYDAGSLNNLLITVPLEAKLPSSNWNYRAGKSTVAKCVPLAISANDTDCARALAGYADLKNADSVFNSIGMKKTNVNDKQSQTTARELGDLLFRLQNGQVLSDKGRRAVFDGLYAQKMREGIPAGCSGQKCLVANINADSKTFRHDAAIVTTDKAQYVVVVMTNGANWGQISDLSASVRLALEP